MFLLTLIIANSQASWLDELNLSPELLSFYVAGNEKLTEKCRQDENCGIDLTVARCWGHERGCYEGNNSYSNLHGIGSCDLPTARKYDKSSQLKRFFNEADFGYLNGRRELHDICTSDSEKGTTLQCSDNLQYCYGRNFFFDFKSLNLPNSKIYREDVIHRGEVGGNCGHFHKEVLKNNLEFKGYLQSWGHELEHFESRPNFELSYKHCDIIIDKPTVIMKLDASVNMYHHFCDFVNLFASQLINGSFAQDIEIVWWDTSPRGFVDMYFGDTWKAFSSNRPHELKAFDGRKVCFKEAMLPLLARQRFGLFYNMPLMEGCRGSGLMHAFNRHILHRLNVKQTGPELTTVRVTILNRSTQHRRIVNINEIAATLRNIPNIELRIVDYNGKFPFVEQLRQTQNSDVFIGMHGSGLTHLLFLPDWAAIFEIYNCGDVGCYYDLARLRDVKYVTWPTNKEHLIQSEGGDGKQRAASAHKKFLNYRFDVDEFKRIVTNIVEYVRRHPKFVEARRKRKRLLTTTKTPEL